MARGSGVASEGLIRGSFAHRESGVRYGVDGKDGEAWLRYEREGAGAGGGGDVLKEPDALRGQERLVYFLGSGKLGRTYLFSRPVEGGALWYEAPVNWYTPKERYEMTPAYEAVERAPLALPVEQNCLHCHATGVAEPMAWARNAWAGAPFRQGGVGCTACHGDAEAHVASGGKVAMLRLGGLAPARLESVCLQCHLEGDVTIQHVGRSLRGFVPGQDLFETAVYFVNESSLKTRLRATSQYEALLRSACRRSVGERMTCLSCHDPHGEPSAEERVAFYRARCLACHVGPKFNAAAHHPEQQDCVACHMLRRDTSDISHEQLTDHDIEARPKSAGADVGRFTGAVDLVTVGSEQAGDRELGLAYAQFAERGDKASYMKAKSLLEKVEAAGQADALVHEQLGYLAQIGGDRAKAQAEYKAALAMDANDVIALTDLAVLEAQGGDVASAESRLKQVVQHSPDQTAAVLTLAALRCAQSDGAGAGELVKLALRYNPDDAAARRFEETGKYAGVECRLQ
jgi:tetratricopeptide (TPR) repeat protein